jgi:Holliday junction resolvasome RuvABC endonuclease subunit
MYLATDQSTNLNGIAVFDKPYHLIDYQIIDLSAMPKQTDQHQAEKRHQFILQMRELVFKYKVKQVTTEGVYLHNNANTHRKLAQMQGCIQDWCINNEITCFSWENAGAWRHVLGIKGKKREELKEATKQYVIDMYGLPDNLGDDIYDAVGLGTAFFKLIENKG